MHTIKFGCFGRVKDALAEPLGKASDVFFVVLKYLEGEMGRVYVGGAFAAVLVKPFLL
jgi:hypothetical protein